MKSSLHTTFAVFSNEVLLDSRRVAPYVLITIFAGNALLWWGWGPAVRLGWATNSEYYIARNLLGFSFLLGLPIFNAVIMGDPVIRDFSLGLDPLIFSKPVSRAEYLLGKFCGNFFVLVCCQAAFALTLLVLQAFRTSQMVVLPVRVFPYFKHFFFFVVISHLALAACYFTVGTLTRNSKIVYGLAVCFYPLYIAYQIVVLQALSPRWQKVLDPLLLNSGVGGGGGFQHTADFLNRMVVSYSSDMIANRVLVIIITALCLTILYLRFSVAQQTGSVEQFSTLNLSATAERVYYDSESLPETRCGAFDEVKEKVRSRSVPIPPVNRTNEGFRAILNKVVAATGIELRLLSAERSLVVIMPLAIFLATLEITFYDVVPDVSYGAAYASHTAKALLLFLIGIAVFYNGETMHRDREVKVESVLWATPAPNSVLLLAKFFSTFLLLFFLVLLVGLTALVIQGIRGHTPVEVSAYLTVYSVILIPSLTLLTALSLALSVLLREKYLTYAVSIGTAAGLFYLYSQGYNHWLYNPLLYQLWTYSDLTGGESPGGRILTHRVYCLAIAFLCLALAHLAFERKSSSRDGRLAFSGWALLVTVISLAVAVITGLMIV